MSRRQPTPHSRLADIPERAGPCERCGIVTTDWMSFDGKTGRCKCNTCFQPNRQKAIEAYEKSIRESIERSTLLLPNSDLSKAG
jgi:hypothetical protein